MKVLIVLGEGGHTTEILEVVEPLGPVYDYSYLMSKDDRTSEGKIKVAGPIYRATLPRGRYSNLFHILKRSFLCSIQEFSVLLKVRPKAILSAGAGIAVPISVFGRLLGVKIVYVESATRVHTLSLTGKIMYHIAHLFFVQWEPLKEKYPKVIYVGGLL